jgi:hypothetical protein
MYGYGSCAYAGVRSNLLGKSDMGQRIWYGGSVSMHTSALLF